MQFPVEFTMPNGNPAVAHVLLIVPHNQTAPRWTVDRVYESPPKRSAPYAHKPDLDSWGYRQADVAGKFQYVDDFFRELLGPALFDQILRAAWLKCKPPNIVE